MAQEEREVASVLLSTIHPTELRFGDLYTWVIWQFPRPKGAGLCGAVRPPIPKHTWYPAMIFRQGKRILVHGHVDRVFESPEDAAAWLEASDDR